MKLKWTIVIAVLFSVLVRGAEPGINFLYNGGFENETNPGMADGWGPFFYGWGMRGETSFYRDLETLMHLDYEEAFEGKKSMRLLLPDGLRVLNIQHPCVRAMTPGKEAVFSAYMKTIKNRRAKVRFWLRYTNVSKTFTVDDQWRRYEVKFKVKKGDMQPWIQFTEGDVLWIDAVKLEHGSQATAFVPFTGNVQKNVQAVGGQTKVPRCQIPVLEKAPELTGTMSDPLWGKALEIKDFYQTKTGAPITKNQTRVRMFIHGTTLYAAAECQGPSGEPLIRMRDGMVWTDDSFEMFLDPGNPVVHDDQKMYGSYYHIVINSAGAVYDIYTGGETRPFNGRILTKASRTDNKWICETAIDLASLNINPVKTNWRFLLGREDHTSDQYSANVPLPQGFHDYTRFAEAEVPASVVSKLNAIHARQPEFDSNGLALQLQSKEKLSAKYELTASRNGKEILRHSGEITLGPVEQTLRFPLSAGESGQTVVELAVQSNSGERLVRSWNISRDSGKYFRRSYYTSEKEAELVWNGELPDAKEPADFNGKKVSWRKADGKLIFDLSGVPDGVYSVRIGDRSIPFAKYPSKANEVKIDRLNNILLVDGKPFIFYGPFIDFSFKQRYVLESWGVEEMKKRGFNGIVLALNSGYIPGSWAEKNKCFDIDWVKRVLDACSKHGLKVIVMCHHPLPKPKFVYVNTPKTMIPKLKDHPAMLAWYFYDEPTTELRSQIWEDYNYTKKADPYHPFLVNVTSQGLFSEVAVDKKTGRNPFDIFALTYYPISRITKPDARLKDSSRNFEKMRDAVRKEQGGAVSCFSVFRIRN